MTAITPVELPYNIVLAGSDCNKKRSRGLSKWSRNVHKWSWYRSNIDAWLFKRMVPSWTAQKTDCENNIESMNRSGSRSRSRSRPIKPTNQLNQQLTYQSNHWPIEPMTNQKHLFGKAKNNWITEIENKWKIEIHGSVMPNAIRHLTKQSTKQTIKNDCLAKLKTIDQTNTRTITITANIGWGLEPGKSLKSTAKPKDLKGYGS